MYSKITKENDKYKLKINDFEILLTEDELKNLSKSIHAQFKTYVNSHFEEIPIVSSHSIGSGTYQIFDLAGTRS